MTVAGSARGFTEEAEGEEGNVGGSEEVQKRFHMNTCNSQFLFYFI